MGSYWWRLMKKKQFNIIRSLNMLKWFDTPWNDPLNTKNGGNSFQYRFIEHKRNSGNRLVHSLNLLPNSYETTKNTTVSSFIMTKIKKKRPLSVSKTKIETRIGKTVDESNSISNIISVQSHWKPWDSQRFGIILLL